MHVSCGVPHVTRASRVGDCDTWRLTALLLSHRPLLCVAGRSPRPPLPFHFSLPLLSFRMWCVVRAPARVGVQMSSPPLKADPAMDAGDASLPPPIPAAPAPARPTTPATESAGPPAIETTYLGVGGPSVAAPPVPQPGQLGLPLFSTHPLGVPGQAPGVGLLCVRFVA